MLTAPEHAAFTSRTGEETTDCRSGKRQSRGARLTHRWRRRPLSSEICPGPFPQGLESSPILFKLTAASIPTPNPGMSKVPQKDSQKSKGAHPGPSLMQGYKLHPAVSPRGDWCPQIEECWPLKRKSKGSTPFFLPPFPGSGTCFCPLDLMGPQWRYSQPGRPRESLDREKGHSHEMWVGQVTPSPLNPKHFIANDFMKSCLLF